VKARRSQVLAAFAAVYLIWGSTYLAMKYAIASIPPFLMTGVRFAVAGALLYGWARARDAARPTGANWRTAAFSGALLVLGGTALVAWAEQWVPSGIAALLVGTVPLWIVLVQWLGPGGRRPPSRTMAGVVLGFAGFAVLVGPDLTRPGGLGGALPAGVLLFSSLLWALGSLYSRRAPLPSPPALGMGMEMLAGGVICLGVGLLAGEGRALELSAISTRSFVALAYLIVFGSLVGFTCYLWLLRVSTPTRVATHIYVNPIVALFLGWAIAGEQVTPPAVVAATIIVTAVVLITGEKSLTTDDE
jgi:drug/metabolite transporter (DMT)-like permease